MCILFLYTLGHVSIKFIVIMIKEGSTKIVDFMESVAGDLMVGCGHMSHKITVMDYLLLYQYTAHWLLLY